MKLVSYQIGDEQKHGILDGAQIAELGDGDLLEWLSHGRPNTPTGQHCRLGEVALTAPISRPGKLLAAAANYQAHVTETGGAPLDKDRLTPRLFLKPSTSIVGPDAEIALPDLSKEIDWEAELGVVIGARVRDASADTALDAVAGYVCANDVSARSLDYGIERDTDDRAVWFFDWLAGKWFDGFAPIGPYLVTADEVPDPQALTIDFALNGSTRQHGSTNDMIFTVAELIAHASRLMTLEPGDIILTGTPAGVGAARGEYLRSGDEMAVTIGDLGTLRTSVR
jgi:2-keto-4-pentenoate hydratase/2-oxohepta-3-ene-1,7-dioic acid hydratase in catechol pathway